MALSYRQVKDLYDLLHGAGIAQQTMPEWAAEQNRVNENDAYSAGLNDNWIKRSSVAIDRGLEWTGAPDWTEAFGRSVGELVGNPEAGANIGRGLPRTAVDFLPMMAGAALAPVTFGGAAPIGLGLSAALSGANTYTATDSVASGLIGAGTAIAMPGVAALAEKTALKALGGQLVEGAVLTGAEPMAQRTGLSTISRWFPKDRVQGLVSQAAGQLGAGAFGVATGMGQQLAAGEPISFSPTEELLNLTLGQLPFAGMYLTTHGRAGFGGKTTQKTIAEMQRSIDMTTLELGRREIVKKSKEAPAVVNMPDVVDETDVQHLKNVNRLNQIMDLKRQAKAENTPSSIEELQRLRDEESKLIDEQKILGVDPTPTLTPDTERAKVTGEVVRENADKTWRLVKVSDAPENGEFAGKWVSYSTKYAKDEQTPEGATIYDIPKSTDYHTIWEPDIEKSPAYKTKEQLDAEANPDLPQAQSETPRAAYFDHVKKLRDIDVALETAFDTEDFHKAMHDFNQVRASLGFYDEYKEPQLALRAKRLKLSTEKEALRSAMNEFAATKIKSAEEKLQKNNDALASWYKLAPEDPTAKAVVALHEEYSKSSDRRFNIIHSGLFFDKVNDWVKAGGKSEDGNIPDALRQVFAQAIATGKELKGKVQKAEPGVAELAAKDPIAAEPLKMTLLEKARFVLDEGALPDDISRELELELSASEPNLKTVEELLREGIGTDREVGANAKLSNESEGRAFQDNVRRAPAKPYITGSQKELALISAVGKTGRSALEYLKNTAHIDPAVQALISTMEKFGDALDRIDIEFIDQKTASYAMKSESKYRTKLGIASYVFQQDPLVRSAEIAHELIHGLTELELARPENEIHVEKLTDLRERMIKRLSTPLQKILRNAEKNDFYGRWSRGEIKYNDFSKELGASVKDAGFLYAFMNNSEFLAQSFTDKDHIEFMKSQKSGNGTFRSEFTGWIKSLFGVKASDSAIDEVMNLAEKIMSSQNAVASVYNYAEQHYKSQGQSAEFAQSQAARVSGFIASSGIIQSKDDVFRVLAVQDHENAALAAATQQAADLWRKSNDDTQLTNWILSELGFEENLTGLEDLTKRALNGHRETRQAINLLPEAAKGYLLERAKDVNDILGVATTIARKDVLKFVNAFDVENVRKFGLEARHGAMAVASYDVEMREITNKLISGAANTSPDGYMDSVVSAPAKPRLVPIEENTNPKMSWIERFLARPAQIARMYPEVAEAVTKGYQLLSLARNSALQGFKAFGYDLTSGNLTKEAVEVMHKAIANRRISRAVDKWIYLNQKEGKDAVVTLPETHPDVAEMLRSLTPKEVENVKQLVMQKEISQREMNKQALEHMQSVGTINGATLIATKTGFTLQQNVEFMNEVMKFCMADLSDPAVAVQARAELDAIQRKVQPDVFVIAMKFARMEAEKYKTWAAHFEANPAWSTAQRYGKFIVHFTDGTNAGVDSKAEAQLLAKEHSTQIANFEPKSGSADDAPHFGAGAESFIVRLQQLERNQYEMLADVLEPDQLEALRRTSAVEQFTVEARAAGVKGVSAHARRLSGGVERVPFLSNHFSWITKNSTYWARQKYQAEIRLLLLDPQLEGRSDLKDWIRTHAENCLRPDPQGARTATAFTTNWLLGFNAASAIANGSQLLLRGAAEMTALTGKPMESYGRIAKAFKEMATQGQSKKWATKEHQWLIERATRDGERNLSLHDIEQATNDTIATNMKRAIAKHGPQTLGQRLGTFAGGYSTAAMWMFRQVEQVNNTGALLAGFDYWREQGLGMEESYKKAAEFNHMVNDVGGKVNRSVGMFSGKDAFSKSAAMIANSMQSYVLGSTFQLVHYIKSGFFRPAGLTPAEVHASRVAAIQMVAVQFAAAGMLGLPFAASVVAVLDKAFPDMEINKNLREWTARLLGNDAENDNMLGDIALTGLPSAFGWDWQSRLSAGNTVPGVSEMNGFQPGLLLGAPASVITNFVGGITKVAQGDASGARNFVPPGFRKLLDLGVSGGQAMDYRGRPVMTPTPGEKVGMALGFQPKRMSDFNAASRMADQAEKVAARRKGEETQRLATRVMNGEFGAVKQELLAKMRQDPTFDARNEITQISRAAEELTFPRDLRREGSAKLDRTKLMDAFNVPVGKASEETRLMFRQQIEANLGVRPTTQAAVITARLMDQLKAQMPDASRTELRRAAELALHGKRTSPLLQE